MPARSIVVLIVIAAAVRVPGLLWGLPGPTHLFSYHPDEFHSLRGALALAEGDLNPHFFNYGCLYLHTVAVVCNVLHPAGGQGAANSNSLLTSLPATLRAWTVDARVVNLVAGLATVVVVALAAQCMGGSGVWAGLAMALMPLHALHCRYATVDVPLTLFVALTVLAVAKTTRRPDIYIWASVCAGLAASTKYTGAVALVLPLGALALDRGLTWERKVGMAAGSLAGFAVAFVLTSPYVILAWDEARRDILFELQHMRAGEFPARAAEPCGAWFHVKWLTVGTGGMGLVGLGGVVMAAWAREKRRQWLPLATLAAALFFMVSAAGVRYARYELPLLPLAGVGLGWIGCQETRWMRVLMVVLLMLGAAHDCHVCARLLMPDSRDVALQELVEHSKAQDTVGMVWEPWFQNPPVDYCNGGEGLSRNPLWRSFSRTLREIVVTGYDRRTLEEKRPEWFVLSEVEERDFRRVGAAQDFWEVVESKYALYGKWNQRWWENLIPREWNPPQDWLYPTMPLKLLRLRGEGRTLGLRKAPWGGEGAI